MSDPWWRRRVCDLPRDPTHEANLFDYADSEGRTLACVSHTADGRYALPVFYIEDARKLKWYSVRSNGWSGGTIQTAPSNPSAVCPAQSKFRFPWSGEWKAATGNDGWAVVRSRTTGQQWFAWGWDRPTWWQRFDVTAKYAGTVIECCAPDGSSIDYRTYDGTVPRMMGAGMPLPPVTEQEANEGIDHVIGLVAYNTGGAVCPAGKVEGPPRDEHAVPEGSRFWLELSDDDLDRWVVTKPTRWRTQARIWAEALRTTGWVLCATNGKGGEPHFVTDRFADPPPDDLLDGLITRDRVRGVAPCIGWVKGGRVGTKAAWVDRTTEAV